METCVFDELLLSRVLPPFLLVVCVLGMLGNGVALWIFCFYVKPWKSSTVFLFNLAMADFLLIVILPFRAVYYLRGLDWVFGDMFCRASLFLLAMNRGGSIFFLTAVAVDRYLRVVYPHHPINSASVSRAAFAAVAIWILTIALSARLLAEPHQKPNTTHCESFGTSNWYHSVFLLEFAVPLVIILFCTTRVVLEFRKRGLDKNARIKRALWCLAAVIATFIIGFLPSNATLLLIWAKTVRGMEGCGSYGPLGTVFYITVCLTYLNSMLDPVVYYFSSPAFKKMYKNIVQPCLWWKEEAIADVNGTTE